MPDYKTTEQLREAGALIGSPAGAIPSPQNATWGRPPSRSGPASWETGANTYGANEAGHSWNTPRPLRRMAEGGRPMPGEPVIVGDGGQPEIFVPDQPGTIVPLPSGLSRPQSGVLELNSPAHGTGWSTGGDVYAGGPKPALVPPIPGPRSIPGATAPPAPAPPPAAPVQIPAPAAIGQPPPPPAAAPQPVQLPRVANILQPADPMEIINQSRDPLREKAHWDRVMRTPSGIRWAQQQDAARAAAAAQQQAEASKFNAEQGTKETHLNAQNQRAQAAILAANERATANINALAERQQTGLQHADTTRRDAEDLAYADAVGRLANLWHAKQLSPEEMIRFEGLQTSKAIEAELKHIMDQRKADAPAKFTEIPDPSKPYAVGSGASPKLYAPQESEIIQVATIDPASGKSLQVPHYIIRDQAGNPKLIPVPIESPPTAGPAPLEASSLTREDVAKLPSNTPIRMSDGTIRYTK